MLSLVISVSCINASASFEHLHNLSQIDGNTYPDELSRFSENYIFLDIGLVEDYNTSVYYSDYSHFPNLVDLSDCVREVSNDDFGTHFGINYNSKTVNAVEFILYDIDSWDIVSSGNVLDISRPVNYAIYFPDGFAVNYNRDSLTFGFNFNQDLEQWNDIAFNYGLCIGVFIYFDNFTPYDQFNDLYSDLIATENAYYDLEESYENALDYIDQQEASLDDYENYINNLEYANQSLALREKELRDDILNLEDDLREVQDLYDSECKISEQRLLEIKKLNNRLLDYENNADVGNLFTGISEGLLIFIRGVGSLGYTTPGGISITIGGLLTVAVLGAFLTFVLKKISGRDL